MVHSQDEFQNAIDASQILFGKGTTESLEKLDEKTFLSVFNGVPQYSVSQAVIEGGVDIIDLLAEKTQVFASKGELRRMIKGGGVSLNKSKIDNEEMVINSNNLLNNKYLLIQKGKKNYFVITVK